MRKAIIKTLAYAEIFNYPLTREELFTYLIETKTTQKKLFAWLNTHKLNTYKNYYYLKNKSNVTTRLSRLSSSQKKYQKAVNIALKLKNIPWIQAVYITGAVSMLNATPDDDIDLMIITSPHKLWTTRILVNSIFSLFGLRRLPHHNKTLNNKLCLNMWLTTQSLKMPKTKQNLYTAHEVVQAKCVWSKNHTHQQFLYQNSWLQKYLPNVSIHKINPPQTTSPKPNQLEKVLYNLQKKIMKSKITTEKITQKSALFHPKDMTEYVQKTYQKNCKAYL